MSRVLRALVLLLTGGRCPTCRQTYPRRIPADQDQRCWTCSTGEDH
ncbi:hypothetical protein [Micromonospora sp. NPDC023633]